MGGSCGSHPFRKCAEWMGHPEFALCEGEQSVGGPPAKCVEVGGVPRGFHCANENNTLGVHPRFEG